MTKLTLAVLLGSTILVAVPFNGTSSALAQNVGILVAPCMDAAAIARIATLEAEQQHFDAQAKAVVKGIAIEQADLDKARVQLAKDDAFIKAGAATWPADFDAQADSFKQVRTIDTLEKEIQDDVVQLDWLEKTLAAIAAELNDLHRRGPCRETTTQSGGPTKVYHRPFYQGGIIGGVLAPHLPEPGTPEAERLLKGSSGDSGQQPGNDTPVHVSPPNPSPSPGSNGQIIPAGNPVPKPVKTPTRTATYSGLHSKAGGMIKLRIKVAAYRPTPWRGEPDEAGPVRIRTALPSSEFVVDDAPRLPIHFGPRQEDQSFEPHGTGLHSLGLGFEREGARQESGPRFARIPVLPRFGQRS